VSIVSRGILHCSSACQLMSEFIHEASLRIALGVFNNSENNCAFVVRCYECKESATGCNGGPLADNDTTSICPIGVPGVGCWVRLSFSSNTCNTNNKATGSGAGPGTGRAGDHHHGRLQRDLLPVPAVIGDFTK